MPFFSSLTARIIMAVGFITAMFLAGAYWQRGRDAKAYGKLDREFAAYKAAVATGQAVAAKRALEDAKFKERTDAEQERRDARQRARIDELRKRPDAPGGSLPPAPAGSSCPEGQACFDRDAFERAYRELVTDLRRLADEGTAVEGALRVAREWARGIAP